MIGYCGEMRSLIINLKIVDGSALTAHNIRACLSRLSKNDAVAIGRLTLLGRDVPRNILRQILLRKMFFPHLWEFQAYGIPHVLLRDFLARHEKLESLSIDTCSDSTCCPLPLLRLDGLENLECPPSCAVRLTPGSKFIRYRASADHRAGTLGFEAHAPFLFANASAARITCMEVDLPEVTPLFLNMLAVATPRLVRLSLTETWRKCSQVCDTYFSPITARMLILVLRLPHPQVQGTFRPT